MSNIIPFDSDQLPALYADYAKEINSDLANHAGGGFPVISIKGKVFTIKRDGTNQVIPNPKDPEAAATAIDVVIVKANKHKSKVFYLKGWKEGDDAKPDCFSSDGIAPDPSVEKPQAKNCATCKNNEWGSKISESGTKLKACSDSIRVAVATSDNLEDPMLLRIPAASMKNLGEFSTFCNRRRVPYNAVVVRISFDREASTPKLIFKPIGMLPPELAKTSIEVSSSDIVDYIINGTPSVSDDSYEPDTAQKVIETASRKAKQDDTVTNEEVEEVLAESLTPSEQTPEEAEESEPEEKPKPKAKAAPKPKAEPKEVEIDIDLSDLDFDD